MSSSPLVFCQGVIEMTRAILVLICLTLLTSTGLLLAGNENAKVAVHLMPYDCDRRCNRKFPAINTCEEILTTYTGGVDIDFFPVFFNLVDYQAVEYAVEWPGSYSCLFIDCSDNNLCDIVWSGDGITQVWNECQPHTVCIPGWGWITVDTPGMVCVVPHPVTGEIATAACEYTRDPYVLDYPNASYCAGIFGVKGHNPCLPKAHATAATTWGAIKHMFR
jgi:hypothetical protein